MLRRVGAWALREGAAASSAARVVPYTVNKGVAVAAAVSRSPAAAPAGVQLCLRLMSTASTEPARPDALRQESVAATTLFTEEWKALVEKCKKQGKPAKFPKEILWLGGAPGAGKGTNTNFIMRERSITAKPIVMSDLLNSPEARAVKAQGGMVGDKEVVAALFAKLQDPQYASGVVVDGFPRTKVQADIVRLLYDSMMNQFRESPGSFPRPIFRIVVLYVEQAESVARQLKRGVQTREHNAKVKETGEGVMEQERDTDFDPELAKKRYRVFKESTYDALVELGKHFTYNLINAQGSYTGVENNIKKEMEYQSRVELNPDTHNLIRELPRASEIVQHARQALVQRLDNYVLSDPSTFRKMVDILESKFYPEIERHTIAGKCFVSATVKPSEVEMLNDIMTDRGFRVVSDVKSDGRVKFEITWDRPTIRRVFL